MMEDLSSLVSDNLGKTLEEVDKLLKSPRTRVEIIALNRQMRTVTSELGKRALAMYKQNRVKDPELAELCARIVSIEARIAEREARLAAQIKSPQKAEDLADTKPCPRCSTPIALDAVFCSRCGYKTDGSDGEVPLSSKTYCSQCGRELRAQAKFCPRCGKST